MTVSQADGASSGTKRRAHSRLAKATALIASIGFGAWLSVEMWPHLPSGREVGPNATEQSDSNPLPAPQGRPEIVDSLLGTDASASDQPLPLMLISTSLQSTLAESTATLGTDRRNPQTYAGGAVLSNGARIDEIYADRIVLSLRGTRTTLTTTGIVTSDASGAIVAAATTVGGMSSQGEKEDGFVTSREDLSEFLRVQPVFDNDRFVGLQILFGTRPALLQRVGLESGDVIRSVEGRMIDSEDAWQQIDDALSSRTSIVVGVERGGNLQSITLDGARLAEASAPPITAQVPES